MKKVFLVSGGLDSYIAWELYKDNDSTALFIDYGQKYARPEYLAVKKLIPEAKTIKIDRPVIELDNNYIPNRNLLLATVAATYFMPDKIIIAGLGSDRCLDKTEEVFLEYSKLLSKYSKKTIVIESPFWEQTKTAIIRKFLAKGHSMGVLNNTYSCYTGTPQPCGECKACLRKVKFLNQL